MSDSESEKRCEQCKGTGWSTFCMERSCRACLGWGKRTDAEGELCSCELCGGTGSEYDCVSYPNGDNYMSPDNLTELCSECDGTGFVSAENDPKTCEHCNGEGEVGIGKGRMDCPRCNGRGVYRKSPVTDFIFDTYLRILMTGLRWDWKLKESCRVLFPWFFK